MTCWAEVDRYLEDLLVPPVAGFDRGGLPPHEVAPEYAAVARENLARAGVTDSVDLRVGPALDSLPLLEGPFDLIFIDVDKRSNPQYLEEALRLSRPGTLILADNVVRDGAVADRASANPSVVGLRRFLERLATNPRVEATAIQTVGSKGWEGLVLATVS